MPVFSLFNALIASSIPPSLWKTAFDSLPSHSLCLWYIFVPESTFKTFQMIFIPACLHVHFFKLRPRWKDSTWTFASCFVKFIFMNLKSEILQARLWRLPRSRFVQMMTLTNTFILVVRCLLTLHCVHRDSWRVWHFLQGSKYPYHKFIDYLGPQGDQKTRT